MGYATVMNVPRVQTYALAKNLHDSIVPIRGRDPEIRPLGNRRDADSYWVKMDGDDVVFMLYKSPVITYKPDGGVVLTPDQYSTVSTHQFFNRVLGVGANASRNTSVITLGDKRFTVRGKDKLTLKLDSKSGNWYCVEGAKTQFAWHLDRREATNVRSRFKEFRTYFKGMVNLRTEEIVMQYYNSNMSGVRISLNELQTAFGMVTPENDDPHLNPHFNQHNDPDHIIGHMRWIHDKPQRHFNYGTQRAGEYKEGMAQFMGLIKSDQPEDTKHTNFYKGALAVLLSGDRIYQRGQDDNTYIVKSNPIVKALDTVLLRAHAEEVLVRKELPIGSVSKGTYEGWLPENA
jgi:hypothetical protein